MTFIIRIMGDGALNAKPIFYHLTTKIQRWCRKCISDISSGISGISSGIFMYFSNFVQFLITTHIYIHVMSVQSNGEEMLEHFHGISRAFPCISTFYLHTDSTKCSFCSKQDISSHLWLGYIDIIQLDFSISVAFPVGSMYFTGISGYFLTCTFHLNLFVHIKST